MGAFLHPSQTLVNGIAPGDALFLRHAPDDARAIVRDKQRAVRRYGHAYRTPIYAGLLGIGHEPRQEGLGISGRLAVLEWNENHLVALSYRAVPGAVFRQKHPAAIFFRELFAEIKRELQCGHVRPE